MPLPKPSSIHRAALAVILKLALVVPAAAAEPPKQPNTPMLADAIRQRWLRAGIVSGRIVFTGARLPNVNNARKDPGMTERLSIRVADAEVTADYEMSTSDEELSVEVRGGSQLRIRRSPKGDSSLALVEFFQPVDKPLRLTLGSHDQQRVYQAASLWHLLIMERETCRQQLVPLLSVLNRQWDLAKTTEQVETALVQAAADGRLPDPGRWTALVEQLGDDRFSRREAADRELRAMGRVVFTYLQQLDPGELDAEQHYRIRRILMTLSASMDNDAPSAIAGWLAGDPAIWLAMLSREELATRRLAAQRLGALLGEPLPFDPEADATTRASQIEQLRARIPGR